MIASADANFANHVRDLADFVLLKPISYEQLRQLATRLKKATIVQFTQNSRNGRIHNSDYIS